MSSLVNMQLSDASCPSGIMGAGVWVIWWPMFMIARGSLRNACLEQLCSPAMQRTDDPLADKGDEERPASDAPDLRAMKLREMFDKDLWVSPALSLARVHTTETPLL